MVKGEKLQLQVQVNPGLDQLPTCACNEVPACAARGMKKKTKMLLDQRHNKLTRTVYITIQSDSDCFGIAQLATSVFSLQWTYACTLGSQAQSSQSSIHRSAVKL